MNAVVVLDASFQPLSIVTLRRAMSHLARERVTVIESVPGAVFRSASAEYPVPRVVMLQRTVRMPRGYEVKGWSRAGVITRDRRRCAYCGSGQGSTVDHILPSSRGGADAWLNTVAACTKCNNAKDDMTPEEARMPLLFQPRTVTVRETLLESMVRTGADLVSLGLV